MSKPILPFLETMIIQACNLTCTGCTNYSDLVHKGYVTWDRGKNYIAKWLEYIDIDDFGIMGGEPLLNPECDQWILGVRKLLPEAQIRFTTNGMLLDNKFDIFEICRSIGNCVFKITVHGKQEKVEKIIDKIFNKYHWTQVEEHGIKRWKTDNNLRFQINRPNFFLKPFKNTYKNMMPYNSQPKKAFGICIQKTCPLLYDGKIYKCSTSALLQDTLHRFNFPNYNDWKHFLVKGVEPGDKDILELINNFGKPNKICSMCPGSKEGIINHAENIMSEKLNDSN